MRLVVPAYVDPHDPWWPLLLRTLPPGSCVVVSPNSGPRVPVPAVWQAVAARLRAARLTPLGYIRMDFGRRPTDEVLADALAYRDLYGITDAFCDEVPDTHALGDESAAVAAVTARVAALRQASAAGRVWLNVGWVAVPDPYLALADVVVTFEGTHAEYVGAHVARDLPTRAPSWLRQRRCPPERLAQIVTAVPGGAVAATLAQAAREGHGWVFATGQTCAPYKQVDRPSWHDLITSATRLTVAPHAPGGPIE